MEKATSDALFRRISPLIEVGKAIEKDVDESCLLVRTLQREDEEARKTSKTSTFSSLIRWKDEKEREKSVRVFVKMIYVDPQTMLIPTTFLNELYLMKTVVRDMIRYGRSPHFIFPVAQVYGRERVPDIRNLREALQSATDQGCRADDGRLGIYNVMEYFDPDVYLNLEDLLYAENLSDKDLIFYLKQVFFQVFYNLTVMEKLRFRHGDLHLKNILVRFNPKAGSVIYSLDPRTHYGFRGQVEIYFFDFDRSSIDHPRYQTLDLTEDELRSFPCLSANRLDQLVGGMREGCWGWNPHADWTRLLAAFVLELSKARGPEFASMVMDQQLFYFPSIYAYFTAVMGNVQVYKFGRPSLKELLEKVPASILQKVTPENILREYVRQFSSESWLQILPVPEPGVPVFKAY